MSNIFIKGVEMKISNICFKVALLGSLVCSSALAKGAFVGVSGGYNYKNGNELKVDDGKIKDAVPTFGVKGGYDFDVARVYGEYIYGSEGKASQRDGADAIEAKWKTHKFLIGADYTPEITRNFKFLAGIYTGLTVLDLDVKATTTNASLTISDTGRDWTIGGKLGGIYSFDERNELEFGVRYDKTKFDLEIGDEKDKIKHTNSGVYLGYNYKF